MPGRGACETLPQRAGLVALRADSRGVTAVEYGLMVGLMALAIVGAVTAAGTSMNSFFATLGAMLPSGVR